MSIWSNNGSNTAQATVKKDSRFFYFILKKTYCETADFRKTIAIFAYTLNCEAIWPYGKPFSTYNCF